jgi:hypothetical protein
MFAVIKRMGEVSSEMMGMPDGSVAVRQVPASTIRQLTVPS